MCNVDLFALYSFLFQIIPNQLQYYEFCLYIRLSVEVWQLYNTSKTDKTQDTAFMCYIIGGNEQIYHRGYIQLEGTVSKYGRLYKRLIQLGTRPKYVPMFQLPHETVWTLFSTC